MDSNEPASRPRPDSQADQGESTMTSDQLAEAKRYGRLGLTCQLAARFVNLSFLVLFIILWARPLDTWLTQYIATPWIRLVAFFTIMTLIGELVSLPLSFYSGHVLEHQFKLSNQSFGGWLVRHLKEFTLGMVMGVVLIAGWYLIIWNTGEYWWLVAAAAYFVVSVVLGQLGPVLLIPLFYKIERLEDPDLLSRLSGLSKGTGLKIEGVYRLVMSQESVKANAMLAGLGRTRRVIMGDTMLEQFSPEEIEVIFAHEIGHHVHHHIPKMIFAGLWYGLVGFWACDFLIVELMSANPWQYSDLPIWILPVLLLVLSVYFMLVEPLQNFISRRYEVQCDRYALRKTQMVRAYVSGFRKLARINKADPNPNPLEVFLFHSHPPIAERLALALGPSPPSARG